MNALFEWRHRGLLAALPDALATLATHAELRGDADAPRLLRDAAEALLSIEASSRGAWLRRHTTDASHGVVTDALRRLVADGVKETIAQSVATLPRDLARLLDVPDVTATDVVALHRRFGAVTASDLAALIALSGDGGTDAEDTARLDRLRRALPALRLGHPRLPLGIAWSIASAVGDALRGCLPNDTVVEPVGSLRRFEPTVGDVELLVTAEDTAAALATATRALPTTPLTYDASRTLITHARGQQVSVRMTTPAEAPFARLMRTGSGAHVQRLETLAAHRGWHLGPCGLVPAGSATSLPAASEADIYSHLALAFVPPELRHGDDEIDLAQHGALPTLLSREDIRGDLHAHTLWSDGRDSVETMALAAKRLGYDYLAITDHSPSAAASRTLTLERLERQRDDVARVRERVKGLTILHGVEVDILPDGALDLPDTVLATLDIVLASLHDGAGDAPARLLARYAAAMRHPLVNIVTHPANRLVGRHDGYAIDYEALFDLAVDTGTVLEVDGGPAHLDLDGHLARRAVAAGVTLSVDSDCHNAERLERQMILGVGTARRGFVEPRHVINTRPLAEVLAFFGRKRGEAPPSSDAR